MSPLGVTTLGGLGVVDTPSQPSLLLSGSHEQVFFGGSGRFIIMPVVT
jgi:hypothetical protein